MKFLFLMILLFSPLILPQSSNAYQVTASNITQINNTTYQFNVSIKGPKYINISAYQCAFTFNKQLLNYGKLSFKYITSTSKMNNKPITAQVINLNNNITLIFASGPGSDKIKSKTSMGTFQLKTTKPFKKDVKLDLTWKLNGEINTIFVSDNAKDITNKFNFKETK